MLGEKDDDLSEAATGMFAGDCSIRIVDDYFAEDDWPLASAFTDEGIETLKYILDETRRNRSWHRRSQFIRC